MFYPYESQKEKHPVRNTDLNCLSSASHAANSGIVFSVG